MINRLLTASMFNFATKVIAALLVLATQVVISRHYVVGDLATWSKLINYINIATVASGIGLNISAVYHLRKKAADPSLVYGASMIAFCVLSIFIFVVLFAAGVEPVHAALIGLFSFFNNTFFLHNARAQAASDFKRVNLQNLLYATVNIIAIGLIYLSNAGLSIYNMLLIQCAYLFVINVLLTKRSMFRTIAFADKREKLKSFFNYGGRIFVTNLLGILLYSGDIILLDFYLDDAMLAEYLLASTAMKFIWLAIDSMGLVLFPEFIQPSTEAPVMKTLNKVFLIVSGLLGISLLTFAFVGEYLVTAVYGSSFNNLFELIIILLIATFGVIFYKFLSRFFAAARQWSRIYVPLIAGIFSNVLLIRLLVPKYEVMGAAYASVGAYVITGFIIGAWYYADSKKLKPVIQ